MSKYWEIKDDVKRGRLTKLTQITDELMNSSVLPNLSFSEHNKKTTSVVPSISLRPILDCGNCKSCNKLCYDIRNDFRYNSQFLSRCKNFVVWKKNRDLYFNEISNYCKRQIAFRWHIGGDIQNEDYLKGMIKVARENKHCRFLCFTKMFDLCNSYFAKHTKPKNLQIVYSGWIGLEMNNPLNFPTSHPLFDNGVTSASDGAKLCSGNCSICLIKKKGCWELKKGEQIVFIAH